MLRVTFGNRTYDLTSNSEYTVLCHFLEQSGGTDLQGNSQTKIEGKMAELICIKIFAIYLSGRRLQCYFILNSCEGYEPYS